MAWSCCRSRLPPLGCRPCAASHVVASVRVLRQHQRRAQYRLFFLFFSFWASLICADGADCRGQWLAKVVKAWPNWSPSNGGPKENKSRFDLPQLSLMPDCLSQSENHFSNLLHDFLNRPNLLSGLLWKWFCLTRRHVSHPTWHYACHERGKSNYINNSGISIRL